MIFFKNSDIFVDIFRVLSISHQKELSAISALSVLKKEHPWKGIAALKLRGIGNCSTREPRFSAATVSPLFNSIAALHQPLITVRFSRLNMVNLKEVGWLSGNFRRWIELL